MEKCTNGGESSEGLMQLFGIDGPGRREVVAVEMAVNGLPGRSSESKRREDVIDKASERGEPGVQGFGLRIWQEGSAVH